MGAAGIAAVALRGSISRQGPVDGPDTGDTMTACTREMVAGVLALTLAWAPGSLLADGRFTKANLPVSKDDGKAQELEGTLVSDSRARQLRFENGGRTTVEIPYDHIKGLLYERPAESRYGMGLLLAWPLLYIESKKHFVTVQHTDASSTGKFEIIRLDKGDVTMALSTLEADTGIKVERLEEK